MKRFAPIAFLVCAGLLIQAFFLFQEWRLTGGLDGVSVDDSWIHYRFSDNIRNGHGFSFNPDTPTPGSTAPLWAIMLAVIDFGYLIPSKIIGIISYIAISIVLYYIAKLMGMKPPYPLLIGTGVLVSGRLAWLAPSGMEITTFGLVTLAGFLFWNKADKTDTLWLAAVVFGFASLLSPEGYLLLALSGMLWYLLGCKGGDVWVQTGRLFFYYLIGGLIVLPNFLFNYLTAGRFLTSTFYAKSSTWGCEAGIAYYSWSAFSFLVDHPTLFVLAILGLGSIIRTRHLWSERLMVLSGAWWLTLSLVYGVLAPCISAYYLRYTTPVVPMMILVGGYGGTKLNAMLQARQQKLADKINSKERFGLVPLLIVEGSLLALLPTLLFWAPYHGQSVADINLLNVETGRWLANNTPDDSVLAVNDIGAIGYFSNRQIIDLGGADQSRDYPINRKSFSWQLGCAACAIFERKKTGLSGDISKLVSGIRELVAGSAGPL